MAVQQRVQEPEVAGLVVVGQLESTSAADQLKQCCLQHKLAEPSVAGLRKLVEVPQSAVKILLAWSGTFSVI